MRISFKASHILGLLLLSQVIVLAGCSSHLVKGDEYANNDDWLKAIQEYRIAYKDNPSDIEAKMRLQRTEIKGSDFYYHRGENYSLKGDYVSAIQQFQYALLVMPDNEKVLYAKHQSEMRLEAVGLYNEANNLIAAGKLSEAKGKLKKALDLFPDFSNAQNKLKIVSEVSEQKDFDDNHQLVLSSNSPITLNFKDTDIRDAYEFLAKSFGVNILFDDSVKDKSVTLYAKDVTFMQGLSLLLATSKTFYKKIGPNSILVSLDNVDKRRQYDDQIIKTFELNTIKAKDMVDIIKGTMTVNKIVTNEQLNTITVRDTQEVISLIDKLIESNDRKRAEVILDVEILEINRTKAENLGLDFGSYKITASVSPYSLTGSFNRAQESTGLLTLPSATLQFMKQDVDARVLANPRIRVLSNMSAKIHIGDRVPLIATTIQDATGQVRNTYDYKDIGIQLSADPVVHLDNSVTVKLGLEVSTLGQNLGTATQPAYSIGSRSAETSMLLRDGETAVLGGLIQDSERNNKTWVPGLGDIPAAGSLFTSYDNSVGRTDVLLTITPRVVRGWDIPPKSERQFYSGTENQYLDKQLFAELTTTAKSADGASLAPKIDTNGTFSSDQANPLGSGSISESNNPQTPSQDGDAAILSFDKPTYMVTVDSDLTIDMLGVNLKNIDKLPVAVLYNPKVVKYVTATQGSGEPAGFDMTNDEAAGQIVGNITYSPAISSSQQFVIAHLKLHAINPGVSYLIYRNLADAESGNNNQAMQFRAARIVVNK